MGAVGSGEVQVTATCVGDSPASLCVPGHFRVVVCGALSDLIAQTGYAWRNMAKAGWRRGLANGMAP